MKKVLIGYHESEPPIMVTYDTDEGTLRVEAAGLVLIDRINLDLRHLIEDVDEIVWEGSNFDITAVAHKYFEQEYPKAALVSEYILADAWCVRKGKKIKRAQQFMNNWLRRTKKDKKESGVIY